MFDQPMAVGLRSWHAFWIPVKAWADYHWGHNGDALRFFAAVVVVVGLPILSLLLAATLASLISGRMRTGRMRALQRRIVLLGLTAELEGARGTASRDARAFDSGDQVAWTVLPHSCVEQALIEAGLLDLTQDHIIMLHELRLRILRANSLASAGVAPVRSTFGIPTGLPAAGGDRFSQEIRDQFEAITRLCDNLLSRQRLASSSAMRPPSKDTKMQPSRTRV